MVPPTRISFGSAACWSRAARFTAAPGDEELVGRPRPDGDGTGVDADPDPQRLGEAERLADPVGRLPDREAGPDGPQRVVLVQVREPPHRHHGVAHELLGPAAQRLELLGDRREERGR